MKGKKRVMKMVAVSMSVCIILMVLAYLIMFLNTNSLVNYVESIYRGKVSSEKLENEWYNHFDIVRKRPEIAQVDIDISRVFVWHNFHEGFMWVNIDCEAHDSSDRVTYGSDAYERWDIKKTERGWEIINVTANTGGRLFPKGKDWNMLTVLIEQIIDALV